jgi:3-hydroxyacyl-CoA dehydrogenase
MSEKIAIIGSGIVGQSWAISFARGGFAVSLFDRAPEAAKAALRDIAPALEDLARNDLLHGQSVGHVIGRISIAGTLADALNGAIHVQENAPEQPDLKRALFAEMDAIATPDTVLASSTSALLPSSFATGLPGAHRCLVAHPLNPPHLIPAVEVVPAPFTASAAVDRCCDILARAGQTPFRVAREVPGFVMNRLQGALLDEAMTLVAQGLATVEDIDIAMRDGLARRWAFMGPFETIDLNAPGGVATFIDRYGPAYAEIGKSRPNRPLWQGELADRVIAARRAALPERALPDRHIWRNAQLARLARHFAAKGD